MLALSVCYHARLQDRSDYEERVVEHFIGPIDLPGGSQQFRDEIRWYGMGIFVCFNLVECCKIEILPVPISSLKFDHFSKISLSQKSPHYNVPVDWLVYLHICIMQVSRGIAGQYATW